MKKLIYFTLLVLGTLAVSVTGHAQNSAALYAGLYYYPLFVAGSESSLGVDRMIKQKIYEMLEDSENGVVTYSITQPTEITFMAFDRKHSDPRIFQVLMEKDGYTLLCDRPKENPCECRGSNLYMLTPDLKKPKAVERPFLFSIRKSLIRELNESHGYQLDEKELETYCKLIERLVKEE